MAKKKVGRREYLGIQKGGMNYFVKYCDQCGSHVYLTEGQLAEFRDATDKRFVYQRNRFFFTLITFIESVKMPRISLAFKSNEDLRRERMGQEVIRINDQIDYHNAISNKQLQRIAGFDPVYFNTVYQEYGGVAELIKQIEDGKSYREIANHFNLSKGRVGQIRKAIKRAGGPGSIMINPA